MKSFRNLVLLALCTCGDNFQQQSEIRQVRVLGVRATPAEWVLSAGSTVPPPPVKFDALAVSPDDRSVTFTFAVCRGGNPFSAAFQCPGADGLSLEGGVLAPTSASPLSGLPQSAAVNIGYLATDGTGADGGSERGIYAFSIRQADGNVSSDVPNSNPQLAEIVAQTDGGADAPKSLARSTWPLDTELIFTPQLVPGSIETYSTPSGVRTEQILYSWYSKGDDGGVEDLHSSEPLEGIGEKTSRYKTPKVSADVTIYTVVRDNRGGTNWTESHFGVR